ncbi:hypothetical protein SLEP1_g28627 [Rubroshorea leprosula]|uniref:Uncharacterized protein n=1 Tax=Rubroshorea leprosula TaxID=152421 RepID=A0AAV5JUD8_9ROSI|nr:hypothetical protein SLEP1_g28627 [Rubroshorea leprosula]
MTVRVGHCWYNSLKGVETVDHVVVCTGWISISEPA